mmetsp:Transcript_4199/g.3080  ORF Transcript_4199/g.3080 Transcript_4199/m.3080 type:complete len:199 (+) Transcript_4199:523-1119(+)
MKHQLTKGSSINSSKRVSALLLLCPYCTNPRPSASKNALNNHLYRVHRQEHRDARTLIKALSKLCYRCGKSFSQKSHRSDHLRNNVCGGGFRTLSANTVCNAFNAATLHLPGTQSVDPQADRDEPACQSNRAEVEEREQGMSSHNVQKECSGDATLTEVSEASARESQVRGSDPSAHLEESYEIGQICGRQPAQTQQS